MLAISLILGALFLIQSFAWEVVPSIPSGRPSQYLALHKNGAYKYGYGTGDVEIGTQEASEGNKVHGQYNYRNSMATDVGGLGTSARQVDSQQGGSGEEDGSYQPGKYGEDEGEYKEDNSGEYVEDKSGQYSGEAHDSEMGKSLDAVRPSGDASYSFAIAENDQNREESSDAQGNIRGRYSYVNNAGKHDISYVAGAATGFLPTGGSLSIPNGLGDSSSSQGRPGALGEGIYASSDKTHDVSSQDLLKSGVASSRKSDDGSYSYSYTTADQNKVDSSDAKGNIHGKYSYANKASKHDLEYIAGPATGFLTTGVSLAVPNGIVPLGPHRFEGLPKTYGSFSQTSFKTGGASSSPDTTLAKSDKSHDGSYSFNFSTGEQSRTESSDSQGSIRGKYSYINKAVKHDLDYVAGSVTGFLPTGGSLATPNGIEGSETSLQRITPAAQISSKLESSNGHEGDDGTYQSGKDDEDGQYKEDNSGQYVEDKSGEYQGDPSEDKDGTSYYVAYSKDANIRRKSSDEEGNIRGQFTYINKDGKHDISYIAGSSTGFLPTGGSLALPNGRGAGISTQNTFGLQSYLSKTPEAIQHSREGDGIAILSGTGDISEKSIKPSHGSYAFSFSTDEQQRDESADAQGNVHGKFSYTNKEGKHDLAYVAGSATGFLPVSGSLAVPNGLSSGMMTGDSGSNGLVANSAIFLSKSSGDFSQSSFSKSDAIGKSGKAKEGSYTSGFSIDAQERGHSFNSPGNVPSTYSYTYGAGKHNTAGVTGSLLKDWVPFTPNGLGRGRFSEAFLANQNTIREGSPLIKTSDIFSHESNSGRGSLRSEKIRNAGDGSYSFSFSTADQNRDESADSTGNVRGTFWYKDKAGRHNLAYIAGPAIGFVPTGGSLAEPNGLTGSITNGFAERSSTNRFSGGYEQGTGINDKYDNSGDGSYAFRITTGEQNKKEVSDAQRNILGQFSYTAKEGKHDLAYITGSATGFFPIGGSPAIPNGLGTNSVAARIVTPPESPPLNPIIIPNVISPIPPPPDTSNYGIVPYSPPAFTEYIDRSRTALGSNSQESSGDATYNFSIDTDEYKRDESSDAKGNIKGSFWYKNMAGQHDLNFVAGSETGFQPVSGSLIPAPGLSEGQLLAGLKSAAKNEQISSRSSGHGSSFSSGRFQNEKVKLHTYLPPSNEQNKHSYM